MGACRERVERGGAAAGDAVCGVIRWWSGRGGAGAGRAGGGADSIGAGDVLIQIQIVFLRASTKRGFSCAASPYK